jgi:phosphomannomutase
MWNNVRNPTFLRASKRLSSRKLSGDLSLIKSISGIRGTIGGEPGENLTPIDILKFTSAFATFIKEARGKNRIKIVIGRDARISGEMVENVVVGTLLGLGVDVINLGLSTTPTVELAVPLEGADAGIILTASHNPKQWNALKLLNHKGEFISGDDGKEVLRLAEAGISGWAEVDEIGKVMEAPDYCKIHVQHAVDLDLVDAPAIAERKLKVVCDCVNSTGGIFVPALLRALNVEVVELYCDPTGEFPHNPEPLPENLTAIAEAVKEHQADLGVVVDPDVDRLAIVCEDGSMFGEEYTLVAVADYVLGLTPGNTVSNLSSTRALREVTNKHGMTYTASAVGEVNVVDKMKATEAVIGGEGNGGVIYPASHYGRDAIVGIALFLSHYAKKGLSCSALRDSYPKFTISKNKIELTPQVNVDQVLVEMEKRYASEEVNTIDGVKIDFDREWVHLRKSNTEPIIRIYAESGDAEKANDLAMKVIEEIKEIIS